MLYNLAMAVVLVIVLILMAFYLKLTKVLADERMQHETQTILDQFENDMLCAKLFDAQIDITNLRRRLGRGMREHHKTAEELSITQKMLNMVLEFDLENNQAFGSVSCEIGRNGIYYTFQEKENRVPT